MFKRRILLPLILIVVFLGLSPSAQARVLEFKSISLTVSNLDRSVAFYENALDFKKVSEQVIIDKTYDALTGVFGTRVKVATLQLGQETIRLEQYLSPQGRPLPIDSRSYDLWFQHFSIVVKDMDQAFKHLQSVSYQAISSDPQTIPEFNKGAAGIKAFKFKDPDRHPLELIYFPADIGRAIWHKTNDQLLLGIDHSAIAIENTERSLAFYCDLLGFNITDQGVNSGDTQEKLDNAFGAVVRITSLRAESSTGPSVEFLQYLTPAGGLAAPADAKPNDIAHVHTVLIVDNIKQLADTLTKYGAKFISSQVVKFNGTSELMIKDPDGHAVMLE